MLISKVNIAYTIVGGGHDVVRVCLVILFDCPVKSHPTSLFSNALFGLMSDIVAIEARASENIVESILKAVSYPFIYTRLGRNMLLA